MTTHTLEIPKDAEINFNRIGIELIDELVLAKPVVLHEQPFPERHAKHTINKEDIIGEIKIGQLDHMGNEVSRSFTYEGKQYSLDGISFKKFIRLAESIQRTPSFRNTISVKTLSDIVFDWIKMAYRHEMQVELCKHILVACTPMIAEYEVWVPIHKLLIQSEYSIGKVTLKPITKQRIDQWSAQHPKGPWEAVVDEHWNENREQWQGYAAATIEVTGENERAIEYAFEQADLAISFLRIFHPATFAPDLVCYGTVLGQEHMKRREAIVFREGKIDVLKKEAVDKWNPEWPLAQDMIRGLEDAGLSQLKGIMLQEGLSPYEKKLLESLRIYSRVSLCSDPSDKMIYLMTALEGVIRKDDSESLTSTLAERMAVLVGRNRQESIAIRDNARKAYAIRSKLLHHAIPVDDLETLKVFMLNTWYFFMKLIGLHSKYQTIPDLLSEIDDAKLGA